MGFITETIRRSKHKDGHRCRCERASCNYRRYGGDQE